MSHLLLAAAHASTSGKIPTPQIRYLTILPVIVMLGGAILVMAVGSVLRRPMRLAMATGASCAVALGSLGVSLWQWADVTSHGPQTSIDHAVVMDGFSALFSVLFSCAMFLSSLVLYGYLKREGEQGPEVHVLALVSVSGAIIMAEANDLVVIFLGLEILSIALYVLAAQNHRRAASGEAALKYFILGSFSSAIFVYGIALTYGATGSTNLTQIADFLSHNTVVSNGVLLAGLALLLVGFSFKIAAVPFHMWTPDVYQGSPSPITGFMAAVAKAGGFAALLRVFVSSFGVLRADWQPVVYGIAVLTLVVGAGLAVVQRDVKRMLAYSSINHAGFVLVGLQAASTRGVSASLYYLFTYTFMVIGSFAVVTVMGGRGDRRHDLTSYRGLAARRPWLALSFAVLLLAQAGVPFTTGFLAKLQVVVAGVDANSVPLAVIAMVTAAVAAFFYLRVGVLMYSPLRPSDAPPGLEPVTTGTGAEIVEDQWQGLDGISLGDGSAPEGVTAGNGRGPDGDGESVPGAGPFTTWPERATWAGTERGMAVVTELNAELLLDREAASSAPAAEGEEAPAAAETGEGEAEAEAGDATLPRVPVLTSVALALCVGVTVVFGVWPAPIVDFAHQATLLFIG